MSAESGWRRCSSCKKEIGFTATYWVCNVSTCNRKRTGLVFCTTSCWDVHLPLMNHREAWAEEPKPKGQRIFICGHSFHVPIAGPLRSRHTMRIRFFPSTLARRFLFVIHLDK
jgi:hypothetical protein